MIRHVEGNLLDDDAEGMVNPVNCAGVMGAGLAKAFKERFPENDRLYRETCRLGALKPGQVYPTGLPWSHGGPTRCILNVATKDHWRDPSRIEWVAEGIRSLAGAVRAYSLGSVAIPMLGCGLGGLAWPDVRPLIERAFADFPDVDVRVYGPAKEIRT